MTTILTLKAQRYLSITNRSIARAVERLSSGQRISSAKDDPAGLAVGVGLTSQIRGTHQTIKNINQSQGVLYTADGALAAQSDILLRLRELALQAANGTVSDTDRENLNNEAQQLFDEFERLATQTQFNGQTLLDGTFNTQSVQVGTSKGQTINLSLTNTKLSKAFEVRSSSTTATTIGTGTFRNRSTVATGNLPYGVSVDDFNGDGNADMVVGDGNSLTISLILGNGDGTFAARTTLATGSNPYYIESGDLNGDGNADIIATDWGSATLTVYLGNGNGTFQARRTIATGVNPRGIVIADLNNDGRADIVNSDYGSDTMSVRLGNGDGTFAARTTIGLVTTAYVTQVDVADFNKDGILDIFSANSFWGGTNIALGNGNGTFQAAFRIFTAEQNVSTVSGDFNEDGHIDIISTNWSTGGDLIFAAGQGNGTFSGTTTNFSAGGSDSFFVDTEDVNGDGHLDLAVADYANSRISIMLGNGNGTFQAAVTKSGGLNMTYIEFADINGDGVFDILAPSNSENTVSIYLGDYTSEYQLSISTQESASNLLEGIDFALADINSARSNIAAIASRLEFAASSQLMTLENLASARSQIIDADYAIEVADLVRSQILQAAGIAVLTQATANLRTNLDLIQSLL